MKKILFLLCACLAACSAPLTYTPAPQTPLALDESARASGQLAAYDLYFTLISHYQDGKARVLILTEPALKLADLTVSAGQTEIHYRAPQIPTRLIRAWENLLKTHFLTPCPPRHITQAAVPLKGNFELEITGGICP